MIRASTAEDEQTKESVPKKEPEQELEVRGDTFKPDTHIIRPYGSHQYAHESSHLCHLMPLIPLLLLFCCIVRQKAD